MLSINPISVNNKNSYKPSFKSTRSNYGITYIPENNIVEDGFIKGFLGILKTSRLMYDVKAQERAIKIKEGLDKTKLDFIA